MIKKIYCLLLALTMVGATQAQSLPKADTRWFEDARFGMFIHFGPYAVLGSGEWVMQSRPVAKERYAKLQDFFNPQAFNAAEWVSTAKEAGMKYMIITSRHHDSFSMWDTKQSDWNIMNTPYGKDILRQLADECKAQGLKLGFYYSLLDWYRDDYAWATSRTGKSLGGRKEGNWDNYIAFMKAQLTELLTNYGDVAAIWFDGHWDQWPAGVRQDPTYVDWHYDEIYALIKKLQPNCMIANNHHIAPKPGEDYQAFEKDLPGQNTAGFSGGVEVAPMPLETCETLNRSWGYSYTDTHYKSVGEIVNLLVRAAGYGANLLLNVGPQPDGRIDQTSTARLKEVGKWLEQWGYTVYGTRAGFVKPQSWGAVTAKGKTSYLHVLKAPEGGAFVVRIPAFVSAKWLNVNGKVKYTYDKTTGYATFVTDGVELDKIDSIIEITTK